MEKESEDRDVGVSTRGNELEAPEGVGSRPAISPLEEGRALGIGRTIHVPASLVQEAVIAHVSRSLSARGIAAPREAWLVDRAFVHLERDGSAVVTWQE